jgi:haloacetate dehalogenase
MGGPYPVMEMWRKECSNVRGRAIQKCGHYVAEEQPEILLQDILEFCREEHKQPVVGQ